jgi:hypothetical protein
MSRHPLLDCALAGGLLLAGGIACAPPVSAAHAPAGLEGWERGYPMASQALGGWVRTHPEAARRFFEWDGHHTERAHAFVTWSIAHPNEGIRAFAAAHPGWPEFDLIAREHVPAANAFMGWCRRFPEAAEALMNHPGGLDWAGRHLYADAWRP